MIVGGVSLCGPEDGQTLTTGSWAEKGPVVPILSSDLDSNGQDRKGASVYSILPECAKTVAQTSNSNLKRVTS